MLINKGRDKHVGVTFIEMLIALGLNAMLLAGLVSIFMLNLNHHRTSVEESRLEQQLHSAMEIMVNEIRRAGYWANASTDLGTDTNNNPFMVAGTDIAVNPAANCILFTYDHDKDGVLAPVSASTDDERYGFRLVNNAIQSRPPGASFDCDAIAGAWEDLTDSALVSVTALVFTLNESTVITGPDTIGIVLRSVDISMTGTLVSDSSITKTLTQHVRVRNDKYVQ